mgnify:CR=1 FL=1
MKKVVWMLRIYFENLLYHPWILFPFIHLSFPLHHESHSNSTLRKKRQSKYHEKTNKTLPVRVLIKRKQELIRKPFIHHLARFKPKVLIFFLTRCWRNPRRTNWKAHFTVDEKRRQKEKKNLKILMTSKVFHANFHSKNLIRVIWSMNFW